MKNKWNRLTSAQIYGFLTVVGLLFFFLLGEKGSRMGGDSELYINFGHYSGVQPIYPLFLQLCKVIFGSAWYLEAAVALQGLFALAGCLLLVRFLDRTFELNKGSVLILFLFSLMPYAIEVPDFVISHELMTEGLAYPLFYFFVLLSARALFDKKYGSYWGSVGIALVLSLIRPQMQFLFAVTMVTGIYITMFRKNEKKVLVFLCSMVVFLAAGLMEMKMVSWADGLYENAFFGGHAQNSANYTVQARVLYAADEEDAELFEDPVLKELYEKSYRKMDEMQTTWKYMRQDLWRWKDITEDTVIDSRIVQGYVEEYLRSEVGLTEEIEVEQEKNRICGEMLKVLFPNKIPEYLMTSLQLMPSGFVASVLFQKEGWYLLYVLCHVGTVVLYLLAVAGVILFYRRKELDSRKAELMLLITGTAVVNVVSTNLILFGLQRYMVYTYGIFYMGMYLLGYDLWKVYGIRMKRRNGR